MRIPRPVDSPAFEVSDRDQRWWSAIRTGDAAAFEGLFRAYATDLYQFALSYVHSPDAAEEVVHLTFCALWDRRHTLEQPRGVRAFLFTAIRNRALNHVRDERTRAEFLSRLATGGEQLVAPVPATDAGASTADLEGAIERAVADLPPRCKDVFILVRQRGMSYADAAAVLEIAPKTVEIHMGRALKILRLKLSPWLEIDW
jgi:RNA polymerase sigma-70 factor (ECF subfamily)